MEYNSDTFNGEINNKLSGFKIPLKAPPKRLDENDTIEDEENALNETFVSPLLSCEQAEENQDNRNVTGQSYGRFESLQHSFGGGGASNIPKKRKTQAEKEIFGRDAAYPAELNYLIRPLTCNLCNANMNSITSARDHYESKSHDRKITNWLTEWCKNTGEPMPKIRRLVKDGPVGPNVLHCDSCDLPLTSLQHASQHYNGKRHKMVIANLTNPSGSGYYDKTGKWIRQCTKPTADSYPRYGIGESFMKKAKEMEAIEKNAEKQIAEKEQQNKEKQELQKQNPALLCDICNISVTSEQQMKTHLQGSKHAKKLKLLGKPPYASPADTILASMQSKQRNPYNDISMFRTPSGNYYCKACNLTFPDSPVFLQHLDSKRHFNNARKKSEVPSTDGGSINTS